MSNPGFYFAQITDIHVGNNNLNGDAARRNLRWALEEIANWSPRPRCILATADLVCSGRRDELAEFANIVRDSTVPIHALPANHDLWGEPDAGAWLDLIGPLRQTVDLDELRIVLFQDIHRRADGTSYAGLSEEELAWVDGQLGGWPRSRAVVAFHAPIREESGGFHGVWHDSNAPEFLQVLRRHDVLAALTGHWHRVNEWRVGGVRVINSGALVGWQWTGIPPYYSFPVRPGYMLHHFDGGRLRAFWRELSQQEQRPSVQVLVVEVGGVHVGGPRPQVCPPHVFSRVPIRVQTCAKGEGVESVEWSLVRGDWRSMQRGFDGLWQDWEAVLDPAEFRAGSHVLAVRAVCGGKPCAYDAVPLSLSEGPSPPPVPVVPGREQVFELFYVPE